MHALILLASLTLTADAKPGLAERLAAAEKVCFVPLSPGALTATLRADYTRFGGTPEPPVEVSAELLGAEAVAALNARLREVAAEKIGRALADAPPDYYREKKSFGLKYRDWDLKELPCPFYVMVEFERAGQARDIEYKIAAFDMEKEGAYIPVMPPNLRVALYEKPKPGKKGKKRAAAAVRLVGSHAAESFANRRLSEVIAERVDAYLDGRKPEDDLETDYFPWSKSHYAADKEALRRGFTIHAGRLRERAGARLDELAPEFARQLAKKLR